MMKLFTSKQNEDLADKLQAAESETAELRGLLEEAKQVSEQLQGANQRIIELEASNADLSSKLEESERIANEQAQTISDLQEQANATPEKVSIRAAELLAATGHAAPVDAEGEDGQILQFKSKYEQYRDLQKSDPAAATSFWDANEKDIIAGK